MFVGNLWILVKAYFAKAPSFPSVAVAEMGDNPGSRCELFTYPTERDHCILIRASEEEYVAYSQKCTHLSWCRLLFGEGGPALNVPATEDSSLYRDGSVLQGPPPRPTPRKSLSKGDGARPLAVGVREADMANLSERYNSDAGLCGRRWCNGAHRHSLNCFKSGFCAPPLEPFLAGHTGAVPPGRDFLRTRRLGMPGS